MHLMHSKFIGLEKWSLIQSSNCTFLQSGIKCKYVSKNRSCISAFNFRDIFFQNEMWIKNSVWQALKMTKRSNKIALNCMKERAVWISYKHRKALNNNSTPQFNMTHELCTTCDGSGVCSTPQSKVWAIIIVIPSLASTTIKLYSQKRKIWTAIKCAKAIWPAFPWMCNTAETHTAHPITFSLSWDAKHPWTNAVCQKKLKNTRTKAVSLIYVWICVL